jgi:hypothetical protein
MITAMITAEGAGEIAGPLGLLVVLLMIVATFLLIKNMNSRLRRLPKSFDPPQEPEADAYDPDDDPDSLAG